MRREKRAKRLFWVKKDPGFCENLGDFGYGSVSEVGSVLWCKDVDILEFSNQSTQFKTIDETYTRCVCIYVMCVYIQKLDLELRWDLDAVWS